MLQKVLSLINKCALKPNPLTNKRGIGVSVYVQFHRKQKVYYRTKAAGFNKNFNRKGGGDNGEQPTEGLEKVALLYTEICPERLPAGGDLFTRKQVAGRQCYTRD